MPTFRFSLFFAFAASAALVTMPAASAQEDGFNARVLLLGYLSTAEQSATYQEVASHIAHATDTHLEYHRQFASRGEGRQVETARQTFFDAVDDLLQAMDSAGLPQPHAQELSAFASTFEVESPELLGGMVNLVRQVRYPQRARQQRIEGLVVIEFIVGPDGVPNQLRVQRSVSSHLDNEAMRVIRTARFTPPTKYGLPASFRASVPINFSLR